LKKGACFSQFLTEKRTKSTPSSATTHKTDIVHPCTAPHRLPNKGRWKIVSHKKTEYCNTKKHPQQNVKFKVPSKTVATEHGRENLKPYKEKSVLEISTLFLSAMGFKRLRLCIKS